MQSAMFVCYNPTCSDLGNRQFDAQHPHFNVKECLKWIASTQELSNWADKTLSFSTLKKISADFESEPLQAMKLLSSIKNSDWRQWLNQEQSMLKNKAVALIQKEFSLIKNKFTTLASNGNFFQTFKDPQTKIPQQQKTADAKWTESLKKQLNQWIGLKNMQSEKFLKNLEAEITKMSLQIVSQKVKYNVLTQQQRESLKKYIFEQPDEYHKKIPHLCKIMKSQIVAPVLQNKSISLKCPICSYCQQKSFEVEKEKPKKKMQLGLALLNHLYEAHYPKLSQSYRYRQLRSHIKNVSLEQCLQESKNYQIIAIIDRTSIERFEESFSLYENSVYPIEILSFKTKHMAKGRFIMLKTHEAIDFAITSIAQKCHLRGQKVHIQTKKIFLIYSLSEILSIDLSKSLEALICQQ